jgi:hypothetical protein
MRYDWNSERSRREHMKKLVYGICGVSSFVEIQIERK